MDVVFGTVGAINPTVTSCGGILIESNWLLTARHCAPATGVVGFADDEGLVTAACGARIVERVCLDGPLACSDLALLRLDWHSRRRRVATVDWRQQVPAPAEVALYGWGGQARLRRLPLQLLSQSEVVGAYYQVWGDSAPAPGQRLVATCGTSRNALKGDSGGPLIGLVSGRPRLLGVLSSGDLRGGIDLYASVAYYRSWITQVVSRQRACA